MPNGDKTPKDPMRAISKEDLDKRFGQGSIDPEDPDEIQMEIVDFDDKSNSGLVNMLINNLGEMAAAGEETEMIKDIMEELKERNEELVKLIQDEVLSVYKKILDDKEGNIIEAQGILQNKLLAIKNELIAKKE